MHKTVTVLYKSIHPYFNEQQSLGDIAHWGIAKSPPQLVMVEFQKCFILLRYFVREYRVVLLSDLILPVLDHPLADHADLPEREDWRILLARG